MGKTTQHFPRKVQVFLDEFTYSSLVDYTNEQHEGRMSRSVRDIIKKAMAEWDDKNARIVGERC